MFRVDGGTRLFSVDGIKTDAHRPWIDVGPDGRFLVLLRLGASTAERLELVRNWLPSVTAKVTPQAGGVGR